MAAVAALCVIVTLTGAPDAAANPHLPGSVLLGFEPDATRLDQQKIEASVTVLGRERLLSDRDLEAAAGAAPGTAAARRVGEIGPLVRLRVRDGTELRVAHQLERLDGVRFAEPDYLIETSSVPDDPSFGNQWPFQNTGQTLNGVSGTAGADENVVGAWDVTRGSRDVVIGEIDSGVDYEHPDLAANIWTNPGGIGGCPAGTHGINVVGDATTCDPMDDETVYGGHGTHVAGILGAVGDNGIGVTGVNWATTILPVKFVGADGKGTSEDLIEGLQWLLRAKNEGVNIRVVNDSQTFKGTEPSQAVSDEIDLLGANDILFVTAAGNSGQDNDDPQYRRYPCGYDRPNEICVTATTQNDTLPDFANYGDETVDLAAPGKNVYSTLRGGTYGFLSGGSMAAPQVAGAAALILSTGYRSAIQLKADILDTVKPLPALAGMVGTGGRLDVCAAIPLCANPDADGDGVLYVNDSCPNAAGGGTVSGCPAAPRSVTLAYDVRTNRFSGRVSAPAAPGCAAERQAGIWRELPGDDRLELSFETAADGSFSVPAPAERGFYYAQVNAETVPGVADCGEARSSSAANYGEAEPVSTGGGCANWSADRCPPAAVSVTLHHPRRHERLSGRLRSRTAPRVCLARRGVTIWRHRHGRRDRRLTRTRTRRNGTYRLNGRVRAGRYYAAVGPKLLSGDVRCKRSRSPAIRVRRDDARLIGAG